MYRVQKRRFVWWSSGFGMGLLVGFGMLVGMLATRAWQGDGGDDPFQHQLLATATHGTDSFAVATGSISESGEAVYFLDYLTGDLQCWVLSNRTAMWIGRFTGNVVRDLGVQQGKQPNYLLVTGQTNFIGANMQRPAEGVVYVCDANTGNFAVYGVQWNRTAEAAAKPQQGILMKLAVGRARNLEIRE